MLHGSDLQEPSFDDLANTVQRERVPNRVVDLVVRLLDDGLPTC